MNGKIKIFSKAIMLNRTFSLGAVLLLSIVIVMLSNNLFVAAKYLFGYMSEKTSLSLFNGSAKSFGLALFYSFCILLSVALVSPLKFSRDIWFYEISKKSKIKFKKIFFAYRPHWFFKSVGLFFSVLFVKSLWALLFFFPCGTMTAYLVYSLRSGISKTMLLLVSASVGVSFLSGLYFCFVTFQRYSLSSVLFYENYGITPLDAIRLSARLMDESCFKLAKLKFSFLAWIISCVLVLPAFYVYPYYKISVSYFLNNILSRN